MRRLPLLLALLLATNAGAQGQVPDAVPDASVDAADTARRARVYARIGTRSVTVGDIEDAIAAQTPFQRQRYLDDPAKLRELATRLVDLQVLAAEAERRDLDDAPRPREAFESNLVQLLMRRTIDARITPQSIPEAEVAAYYAAHPDEFSRAEMVRASHVLVPTEAAAREMLERCRAADIAAFRQWARDGSLDTETKQSGGDLRYFTRDGRPVGTEGRPVNGAIVAAAFAIAEVGECAAEPVAIEGRFSVIKLTGRRASETTPLATADTAIRRKLWRRQRDEALDALVTDLRTRIRVTQRNELVGLVEVAPPDPSELGQHRHGSEPENEAETHRPATPSMR